MKDDFLRPHQAVHYPNDRRFRLWVRPSVLIGIAAAIAFALLAAGIEFALVGLPYVPVPPVYPNHVTGPHGFPLWVRYSHRFNSLFVMRLIHGGLSILVDPPRLYCNGHRPPNSEWIRFTPIRVPAR